MLSSSNELVIQRHIEKGFQVASAPTHLIAESSSVSVLLTAVPITSSPVFAQISGCITEWIFAVIIFGLSQF